MASSNIALVLCFFLAINTVGDTSGWAIGVDYSTWTSNKIFVVDDSLEFNYGPGNTVDEVTASDYSSCITGNPISTDSSGVTTIALETAGIHYFISAVPGDCPSGMRLAVKVESSSASIATPSSERERFTF